MGRNRKVTHKIHFYGGAMGSGKTTMVMHKAEKFELANYRVKYVVNIRKTKGKLEMINRTGCFKKTADYAVNTMEEITPEILDTADVWVVDEAWMMKDICSWAVHAAFVLGKLVIVSSIDKDKHGRPFENIKELMAFANKVKKINAACKNCGGMDASFSHFTGSDTGLENHDLSKYISLCGKCFYKMGHDSPTPYKKFVVTPPAVEVQGDSK